MFRFLLLSLLLVVQPLISSFAYAQSNSISIDKAICDQYTQVAASSMTLRQVNEPINKLLERVNRSTAHEKIKKNIKKIISDAYSHPIAKTKEGKEKAVRNYTKTVHSSCANGKFR